MRTFHPHAQPGRLATLDTGAGTSRRNEAEEETDEIYEAKRELDETSHADEETDEPKNGPKHGRQNKSNLTKRKKTRVVPHSRNKDKKKKDMDSKVIQWMSRG